MAKNKNKADVSVANVVSTDVMDAVRAGLTAIRGKAADPNAVAKMTKVMRAAGVKIESVMNRSVVGGFNVTGFQNVLYVCNARDGWGFTDPELAVAWAACLPANNARVGKGGGFTTDPTKYVGGTRTLFNAGKHGPTPTGYVVIKSMRYVGNGAKSPVTPPPADTQPTETELPTQPPVDVPAELITA
jgi:hypothetical protein